MAVQDFHKTADWVQVFGAFGSERSNAALLEEVLWGCFVFRPLWSFSSSVDDDPAFK